MQFVLGALEVRPVKFKQFAALPFRTGEDDLEILLITTRKRSAAGRYRRDGRSSEPLLMRPP